MAGLVHDGAFGGAAGEHALEIREQQRLFDDRGRFPLIRRDVVT